MSQAVDHQRDSDPTDGVPRNRVLVGDARSTLTALPDGQVDQILTSPPYFRLRRYDGGEDELGIEANVEEWVTRLTAVADELRRVLSPSGTLWLNLGDTYAVHPRQGAGAKSLLLGPERLALQLVGDGWLLRNKLIWHKTNPTPSSVTDRLTASWEIIYILAPQRAYYFDLDSLRRPHRSTPVPRRSPAPKPSDSASEAWLGPNAVATTGLDALKRLGRPGHPLGKNPGDVWQIATSRTGHGHHATYPLQLAQRAVLAGCPQARCRRCRRPWTRRLVRTSDGAATRHGPAPSCSCRASSEPGLVLDPFIGSGTTALAAQALDRDWLGIELSPDFAALAERRIAAARAARQPVARGSPAAA